VAHSLSDCRPARTDRCSPCVPPGRSPAWARQRRNAPTPGSARAPRNATGSRPPSDGRDPV